MGAQTVRADNPQLTIRPGEAPVEKIQPWRVVLTRSGDLPQEARLLTDEFKDRTLVLRDLPLIRDALHDLAARGVTCVLIEGGGNVVGQALQEQVVDEVHWFIAPRLCGAGRPSIDAQPPLDQSIPLDQIQIEMLGDNVHISGITIYPPARQA